MNVLIGPIRVPHPSGSPHCILSGEWRTSEHLTGSAVVDPTASPDGWILTDLVVGDPPETGSVEFGVSCLNTLTLLIISHREAAGEEVTIDIGISGVDHTTVVRTEGYDVVSPYLYSPTIVTTTDHGTGGVSVVSSLPDDGLDDDTADEVTLDFSAGMIPCGTVIRVSATQDCQFGTAYCKVSVIART